MRSIPLCFFLLLLLGLSSCLEDTDIATGDSTVIDSPAPASAQKENAEKALEIVNKLREEGCTCGNRAMPPVPALRLNAKLNTIATNHSADQARMNDMSHLGSDGRKVGQRATDAGYAWRSIGENVAWNYRTIESAMGGWKDSPSHCRNMMSASFKEMGVGGKDKYWTQVFAAPR